MQLLSFLHWSNLSRVRRLSLQIGIFSPIFWYLQTKLPGTLQSFVNGKHAKCTNPSNGKIKSKGKWGKLHFLPCPGTAEWVLHVNMLPSLGMMGDSHRSPKDLLKEEARPWSTQMPTFQYQWCTYNNKSSETLLRGWDDRTDQPGSSKPTPLNW